MSPRLEGHITVPLNIVCINGWIAGRRVTNGASSGNSTTEPSR